MFILVMLTVLLFIVAKFSMRPDKKITRAFDGNMLNSDDQRRSTGIVPLYTGMPARCKPSATLRQRHRPCRRNESPPDLSDPNRIL